MAVVKVYTTSLHSSRIEFDHSQLAVQLLSVKGIPFEEIDLNSAGPIGNTKMRIILYSSHQLFKIKRENNTSSWPLPQIMINGVYIGGYPELQYLEDSGDLTKILTGKRCPHVYLHFLKGNLLGTLSSYTYCPICNPNSSLIIRIDSNYSNSVEDFQLIRTLLNSHVTFSVIDIDNPKVSKVTGHSLHGHTISREALISHAENNLLIGMLNKEICIKCLKKTILCEICSECKKVI
ncbi:unnamed protein product [Blepharisma stoltei]|uniref:Uncharacterized protein n=1 Tax=Blepharisma stoltei TaxID=1481888 RepID=A0AAU9IGV2_9CILI|nr:unnamed protein product [Blepharisma stoltei]